MTRRREDVQVVLVSLRMADICSALVVYIANMETLPSRSIAVLDLRGR
jgi:hypothetical protein